MTHGGWRGRLEPRLATAAAQGPEARHVLEMRVDAIESESALALVHSWCLDDRSRMVCAANVHMVMEARDDPSFRALVNSSDLVLADGQPLVWALRLLGLRQRHRVRVSPDFIHGLIATAASAGVVVGLYGGTDESLDAVRSYLTGRTPAIRLGYAFAPPFRPLTDEEDRRVVADIKAAGVKLLLVGIGCPKQELWMGAHAHDVESVMIGVGAAFDLFAGHTREAPTWTRDIGLEWAYRLILEPRRLWRRYARTNPRFVVQFGLQLLRERLGARGPNS
jgi:N-acetylglucosaminyldiphosphoundecaprenol N-acetyl-beta-D-mannosaminyltransferase